MDWFLLIIYLELNSPYELTPMVSLISLSSFYSIIWTLLRFQTHPESWLLPWCCVWILSLPERTWPFRAMCTHLPLRLTFPAMRWPRQVGFSSWSWALTLPRCVGRSFAGAHGDSCPVTQECMIYVSPGGCRLYKRHIVPWIPAWLLSVFIWESGAMS